jgi:hypothetical protein
MGKKSLPCEFEISANKVQILEVRFRVSFESLWSRFINTLFSIYHIVFAGVLRTGGKPGNVDPARLRDNLVFTMARNARAYLRIRARYLRRSHRRSRALYPFLKGSMRGSVPSKAARNAGQV